MAAQLGNRRVEGVLFDYGLTLVSLERPQDALRQAYAEVTTRLGTEGFVDVPDADALLREVHDLIEQAIADHNAGGTLEEFDVVAAERAALAGVGLDVGDHLLDEIAATVQEAWWQGIHLPQRNLAVLDELRRRGLRVGLCSNAPYRRAGMTAQLRHLGLGEAFDAVTFSAEVGWRKPAPQIFVAGVAALGTPAATTVMVGDRTREDIAGARAVGMPTIRTREHRDDPQSSPSADAVINRLDDLLPLLFAN